MKQAIGIDLGGTNIRLALVTGKGDILHRKKQVVGEKRAAKDIVDQLVSQISGLQKEAPTQTKLVGIGVPGIVSADKGIIYSSPHYPLWKDFDLVKQLRDQIGQKVVIDNDVNMVALGEQWKGAAHDWPTFIMITLGTGIGGALIIDSKVFHGVNGFAGEVGHMVIETEGPPCACGSRGCFETYASASGLTRMIREALVDEEIPGSSELSNVLKEESSTVAFQLMQAAQRENHAARGIFERMGYYLGIGLASLINVTGIDKIVLGGGLIGAESFFLRPAYEELKKRTYQKTTKGVEIRLSQLSDDAGVLGAARAALANEALTDS